MTWIEQEQVKYISELRYLGSCALFLEHPLLEHSWPDQFLFEHSLPENSLLKHSLPEQFLLEHYLPETFLFEHDLLEHALLVLSAVQHSWWSAKVCWLLLNFSWFFWNSYVFLMHFLCISYALFMHFLCTFKKCIRNSWLFGKKSWIPYALFKSA